MEEILNKYYFPSILSLTVPAKVTLILVQFMLFFLQFSKSESKFDLDTAV